VAVGAARPSGRRSRIRAAGGGPVLGGPPVCSHLRLDGYDWVEFRGEDLVPVEPVYSLDGMRIVGWRAHESP
jgi:hypothetical protein